MHPDNIEVGRKLGIATALMFTMPFVAYFSVLTLLKESSQSDTWAAGAAIVVTNLIVGGYCYVAYMEDRDKEKSFDNDEAHPRVGVFKQRTD